MKQLSPTDSQMLFVETNDKPNHIAPLIIYDPSTAPGGKVTHKGILANLASRLDQAPAFRRKLVRVPLEMDEPYWVDDPNFDLEYHVRHLALPQPGDWRQLCIQVARLIARPLDPTRPLWELNIIEGLDNIEGLPPGCFAILMKIHHSLMDGKAGAELINVLHDLEPLPPRSPVDGAASHWAPGEMPSPWRLAAVGLRRMVFKPGHAVRVVARAVPGMIRNKETRRTKAPFRVPNTPLNGRVTSARVFDARFYSLADFKSIRSLVPGATINDVALAVVGGAMRRYLDAKGALPRDSLITSVPISIRTSDSASQSEGNEIIAQNVPLCTNIENPVERLQALCDVMSDAKVYVDAVGARKMAEISSAIPGYMTGLLARALTTVSEMAGQSMIANTVVTNVPGVQVPLYMSGAKALLMCGSGPLVATMGTIHIVGSYCGKICINITAARDLMPDPQFYSECLDASFREYLDAVGEPGRVETGGGKVSAGKARVKEPGSRTGRKSKTKAKPKTKSKPKTKAKPKVRAKPGARAASGVN